MNKQQLVAWLVGPLLVLGLGALWGRSSEASRDASFFDMPKRISKEQNAEFEAAVFASVANAAWAFGDITSVRSLLQSEIHRLEPQGGSAEAQALLRFALIDNNPDGRKALFARACNVDVGSCEDLEASQRKQAEQRFVPPGNAVSFELRKSGHPAIGNLP